MPEAEGLILDGAIVGRDDPRYETLRRGFNLRWVGDPRWIVLPANGEDVRAAVQHAVSSGLRPTMRSGGHCYEDFAVANHGGLLVDMAAMNRIYRDPARAGAFCVEAGASQWAMIWSLYKEHDRAVPGGSCYSVGAGGHICGGGYGLLSRLHGLTIDWLDAVEIVTVGADGIARLVVAEKEGPAADLLWACRGGGGGNFGIITRYWFGDLPRAPGEAHLVNLAWDWASLTEQALGEIVGRFGAFFAANSAPGSPYAGLFALLHLTHKSAGQVTLTAQYVGDAPGRLDDFIREMSGAGIPEPVGQRAPVGLNFFPHPTTEVQRLPWLYATQSLDGSGPNRRGKYKSAYMNRPFPEAQIATMWQFLTADGFDNSQALLQVDSYGCAINAVAPEESAVPQRRSIMKLQYQTYWTDPADTDKNLAWIRGFYEAMYGARGPVPDGIMDGCYVNYPDVDLEGWQHLYYQANYPRLQRVKAAWDPRDVFNHKQSIALPA
jgi:FAD/FMN-containing dehydrogenase